MWSSACQDRLGWILSLKQATNQDFDFPCFLPFLRRAPPSLLFTAAGEDPSMGHGGIDWVRVVSLRLEGFFDIKIF